MPIYCYCCEECEKEVEVVQSFFAQPPICCGYLMRKLPTAPAVITMVDKGNIPKRSKGYKEDYAKDYQRRLQEAKS